MGRDKFVSAGSTGGNYQNKKAPHRFGDRTLQKFKYSKDAIQRKKRDLEVQSYKKSAMLRKYAKLCKAEGIQSDRVNLSGEKRSKEERIERKKMSEKQKPNPFAKALEISSQKAAEQQRIEELKEKNLADKKAAEKKRKEKSKMMMKRTKKGQPILGNHIKNVLEKLMKDK